MTENIESETTRANLANLSKIPATEFEKHFHEWMERDDVARGLQAKLRCDLIKNFNKTNLGKQMMAHTMSSTGGSTYRLALTPLVLALNTLVAEFLYAQNCHFTLSVFCTEIPFRNALPDFDSMRNFRFNEIEINDIWEAVTGTAASKRCLDATILEEYETNPQNSLLLLLLKSLLDMKPLEMLRKSVEIQTDCDVAYQEKHQRTTAVQATAKSPAKSPDNLRHINKYLLILSQKVNEMTHEFELLVKQKNMQKPQQGTARKTTRSRELYTLNRSLDRINENVKQLAKSKRKGKRLTNVVESIDGLTKQFGKCAENFGHVTRELSKKERLLKEQPRVNFKEKQTETEAQEKTYADWIYEMRTTGNGKKFLEKVENSLSKAVAKHKEQWQNETDAKLKHMKSLIKLHYKQKMLTHLARQGSDECSNEVRKLNESIETRLKQFELKQLELAETLRESSLELHEAQKQLQEQTLEREESVRREEKKQSEIEKGMELQKQHDQLVHEDIAEYRNTLETPHPEAVQNQLAVDENNLQAKETADVSQKQLQEMVKVVTPRDHNVDRIITDAKLRLQQLETESNCLEQHFQIYLERRKHEQQSRHKLIAQSRSKTSEIFSNFFKKDKTLEAAAAGECLIHSLQSRPCPTEDDLDFDMEFLRLKEKLKETQLEVEASSNHNSGPATNLELKNAIVEAKHRFFENEELFRKRKEKELQQLNDAALFEEQMESNMPSYRSFNNNHVYTSNVNVPQTGEKEQIIVFNINSNISNVANSEKLLELEPIESIKPKSLNKPEDNDTIKANSSEPQKRSPRRELFPKESLAAKDIPNPEESVRYLEPTSMARQDLRQALRDLKTFTQNMENKESRTSEGTAQLIKQSMAKMKQLFGEQDNEMTKGSELKSTTTESDKQIEIPTLEEYCETSAPDLQDMNQTTSTTSTSHIATTTTSTTLTNGDAVAKRQLNMLKTLSNLPSSTLVAGDLITKGQVEMFKSVSSINRISNTSMPSLLNLTSDSEDSSKADQEDNKASDEDKNNDDESSSETEIDENDKNPIPELLITPKGVSLEIGEVLTEPQAAQFAAMTDMTSSEESSDHFDTESDNSKDRLNVKEAAKTSDESESDFWA